MLCYTIDRRLATEVTVICMKYLRFYVRVSQQCLWNMLCPGMWYHVFSLKLSCIMDLQLYHASLQNIHTSRNMDCIMSLETLRMVYFAHIHSIISYGIIFWGNQPYSDKIFGIQKRVIRIITSSRTRDSCRELFKKIRNTTLIFYIYLLNINICYKKNKHIFYTNNQTHNIHTRFKNQLTSTNS